MTKVNVISGFLGAGKTTLIKKLLDEALKGEKIVLIENEFGEIGIDGGFLKDAGVEISEMNSGCICCSLVGDFGEALKKVMDQFHPDRILIEPSGVGKLSDVVLAVQDVAGELGYTTAYLCAAYKKSCGKTVNQRLTEMRMSRAKGLLSRSERKLYEVARTVGYSDGKYFAKLFTRETGLTPKEYREKHREI